MIRRTCSLALLALLLALGCDDMRTPGPDGGGGDGGSPSIDAAGVDAAGIDAGAGDAGGGADAGMSLADVGLTFSGCAPDFSGPLVVLRNTTSIAVSAASPLTGSIQLALEDPPGTVAISTQHRIDSGSVINVIAGSTWTNIALNSADVLSGAIADPIGGTVEIRTYDEAAGMVDVSFDAVTLQSASDGSICQVDGRLRTFGLSF